MRIASRCFPVFVLTASLIGQTPVPVSTTKEATLPPPTVAASSALVPQKAVPAEVAPNAPVVTLEGVCEGVATPKAGTSRTAAKGKAKTCKTVITRAQMDAMLDILMPGATPDNRHQFALNYIRMMAASSVAREKHLDHDPAIAKEMEARIQFTRMQVMASSLYRNVEKLADDVPQADLEKYYTDHAANFTLGGVQRILLLKSGIPSTTPVDLAMLKAKAEEFRARAAKGEDFEQLQKEAAALNPTETSVNTKTVTVRRSAIPPAEAVVFDLKAGEVTPVIEAPGAFEIIKLVSLKPVPLDSVRAEIKAALTNSRLQSMMRESTKDVTADFNLAYLNLPSAPDLFLAPSLRQPAGGAPAGPMGAMNPNGPGRRGPMQPGQQMNPGRQKGFPMVQNPNTPR